LSILQIHLDICEDFRKGWTRDGQGGEGNFMGESAVWFKVQKHGRFRINMPFAGAFSSAAYFAKLHKNGARSFVVLRGRIG